MGLIMVDIGVNNGIDNGINNGIAGWWFGTMVFYDFPFSWECHYPNWLSFIFFRGVETTNQD